MASNVIALRMKYRQLDAEKLEKIINNECSSELEIKLAQEFLDKLNSKMDQEEDLSFKKFSEKRADKKVVPKKEEKEGVIEDYSYEAAAERQNRNSSTYESEEKLTPEEEARLAKAEAEYEARQKNRKTSSKLDKGVRRERGGKADKAFRETKRQDLEESKEILGIRVGSRVRLKDEDAVGEVTRIYKSGDGKEKCMVKFGDDRPIKKRVTALEPVEETKATPTKKIPNKK